MHGSADQALSSWSNEQHCPHDTCIAAAFAIPCFIFLPNGQKNNWQLQTKSYSMGKSEVMMYGGPAENNGSNAHAGH
jgi:hypothetical protein